MRSAPGISRREALRLLGALAAAGAGAAVLGGCSRALPAPQPLRLATGPAGAVYREMGGALVELWNEVWDAPAVTQVLTGASVDNLALLLSGEVELGLVNVDVAAERRTEVRALLRIFDSVLQVVVPAASPVRRLADLDGLPVSVGLPGSGTRFLTDRLLEAAGIEVRAIELGQLDASHALLADEVEAFITLTAMPTPAVEWLLDQPGEGFRFLNLEDEAARLHAAHRGEYLDVVVSTAVYPGAATTPTVAVPTLLAARPDLPDDVAELLVRTTLEEAARLRSLRPEAWQINPRTAVATAPVPLHPGAAAWLRSVKA
ncbi:MAG: TAXI family TRAP transporter solute-binding subunit [Cellulomonadaceae bacterium]